MIAPSEPACDPRRRGPPARPASRPHGVDGPEVPPHLVSRASDAATDEPALASAVSAPEPVAIVVADHGMIVAGTINVRPVEFLVDTGAAVSLLSEALANDLGFAAEHLRPLERVERYCGAGGQPLKLLGTVSVHLQVQACECDHDMRVVRSLRHPCILGRDVLSHIPGSLHLHVYPQVRRQQREPGQEQRRLLQRRLVVGPSSSGSEENLNFREGIAKSETSRQLRQLGCRLNSDPTEHNPSPFIPFQARPGLRACARLRMVRVAPPLRGGAPPGKASGRKSSQYSCEASEPHSQVRASNSDTRGGGGG